MKTSDNARIAREIATLDTMTLRELQAKWVEVWREPCRAKHKGFLRKRIAWKIQANASGGLSQRALERARELADETLLKIRNPAPFGPPTAGGRTFRQRIHAPGDPRIPAPGTVITRDYKGRKLLVGVLDNGFEFEGSIYRSLSAVAKAATGAHWNGMLFFGLEERRAA